MTVAKNKQASKGTGAGESAEIKLYTTLEKEASAEMIEKKSVFIGSAAPAKTEEDALAFIDKIKHKHGDAAHNVYAYMVRGGAQARYTDGGEPQGTAGIPILDVIRKNNFTDAVIVVTRYFGGILLGAGGLVRAYSASAKLAVDAAGIVTYEPYTTFNISCSYQEYQRLQNELPKHGVEQDDIDFGESITMKLGVRAAVYEDLVKRISEMTNGRCVPTVTGSRFGKMK